MKHLLILMLALCPNIIDAQLKNVVLEDRPVPKPSSKDTVIENWDATQQFFKKLTPVAKDFFYWANYSRLNPKRFWDSVVSPILEVFPTLKSSYSESLKKDLFTQSPLPLFKLNPKLLQTSQSHASDVASHKGKPGHISTDGRTFADRIKSVGIKNCGGENVSIGNVDPILSLVLLFIDYGLPELGHRKALLNPNYVETGIGVANYGDENTIFIVQDFSCSQQ